MQRETTAGRTIQFTFIAGLIPADRRCSGTNHRIAGLIRYQFL